MPRRQFLYQAARTHGTIGRAGRLRRDGLGTGRQVGSLQALALIASVLIDKQWLVTVGQLPMGKQATTRRSSLGTPP